MRALRGVLVVTVTVLFTAALPSLPARALDKQGSAHGGDIEGATSGVSFGGSASFGVSLHNPTYAARPDNSGRALLRYAAHFDLDLIGRRLSIPFDINMFTDRLAQGWWRKAVPSELDLIGGVTSTWRLGPGAIEGGARIEHDRRMDGGGYPAPPGTSPTQTYGDVRARYLYSMAAIFPTLAPALRGGDVSGWLTLGWFAYNNGYFARPDNTGLALFRYAVHSEVSFWKHRLAVGLDAIFFTDKTASNVFRPSELDFTPELIARIGHYEVHLAYERDMPLDRGGLVQHFVYLLAAVGF
jgi:hypothetical protein